MDDQVSNYCDKISKNILAAYKMGIQHGTPAKYADTAAFTKLIENLCKEETLFTNEINAAKNFDFEDLETIDQEFNQIIQECQSSATKQLIMSTPRYTNFKHQIEDLLASQQVPVRGSNTTQMQQTVIDDDLQMGSTENLIDPISKQQIKNPFRNRHCKHLYHYESICEAIRLNNRLRCPYVGCINKNRLVVEDLVEDCNLRYRIMQHENESEISMHMD